MLILCAGFGAALGAMLRVVITDFGKKHWAEFNRRHSGVPTQTVVINLTGTLFLGLLFGLKASPLIYALLGTGMMGGYTTFSTLNVELATLFRNKQYLGFVKYALITYLGGIVLLFLGLYLGKLFN